MTASMFVLHRYEDPSDVSGTGTVADGYEAPDGAVTVRWRGERPSWGVWNDIRDVEAIHGHGGKTIITYLEPHRLVLAYQQVCFWLTREMHKDHLPMSVGPHHDWPDRLLVTFRDEDSWRFWVALLDGSTDAATHEEVRGRYVTTWVSPDGNVWLQYDAGTLEELLDGEQYEEDPLAIFDREDRI